jgi:hypothetical protein
MPVYFKSKEEKLFPSINEALAKAFGIGNVEIRSDPRKEFPYVLWILEDEPSQKTIDDAKAIIEKYIPTEWHDELRRITYE